MSSGRALERCIFCGHDDMTEEHLVADWVLRAFHRSRRPPTHLSGSIIGANEMRVSPDPPISTLRALCRECNNTWVSRLDNAAAQALRPLMQGNTKVTLGQAAQTAVAAWTFKTALMFDVLQSGENGPLASLRESFFKDRIAPPGTTIWMGPAPPIPLAIPGVPEASQMLLFGVRPTHGSVNATINVVSPEGSPLSTTRRVLPTPGWTVMLGRVNAIISGRRGPIIPTPDWEYGCVWPASSPPVRLTSCRAEAQAG